MALLSDIRADIAAALSGVAGLNVYDTPRDRIGTPAVMIIAPELVTQITFGGGGFQWDMVLQLLFSRVDVDTAVERMDPFVSSTGASSLITALHADHTLGRSGQTSQFREWRDIGVFRLNDIDYLGAEMLFEVVTSD